MCACTYKLYVCVACIEKAWSSLTHICPLLQGLRGDCCHCCQRTLILNAYTMPCLRRKVHFFLVLSSQPLLCAGIILGWQRLKEVAVLSAHFMLVSSILYRDTPCASHLLCKNNLTWHGTTLTELFLEKTFGNQFASPIIFQIPRQSNAFVWHMTKRPPSEVACFGTLWCALRDESGGQPSAAFSLSALGSLQQGPAQPLLAVSWGALCWIGLTWGGLLCRPLSLPVIKVDCFVLLSICHIGKSFGETAAFLCALSLSETRDRLQWKVSWIHTHWFEFCLINENCWDECAGGSSREHLFGQCVNWTFFKCNFEWEVAAWSLMLMAVIIETLFNAHGAFTSVFFLHICIHTN